MANASSNLMQFAPVVDESDGMVIVPPAPDMTPYPIDLTAIFEMLTQEDEEWLKCVL